MDNFCARSVFFVKDGEAALAFYTNTLGFGLDWNNQYDGRACVFQVSRQMDELPLRRTSSRKWPLEC
jgi:catechol 2,3-dioxygenase-like lactoylglutathione lyase family enzyme